jgi:DNA replication protein DnaC
VYHIEEAAQAVASNLPDAFDSILVREMTFESFDPRPSYLGEEQAWSLHSAYKAALSFAEEPTGWLLLWGPNGCGKTHLAAAIANRCRLRGERPVFFLVADLLDYLRQLSEHDGTLSFAEGFSQLRNAPLLILDGLESSSDLQFVRDRLFQLVNHRYMYRLPTVFTIAGDRALTEMEPRLAARLNDPNVCGALKITAPAYRVDIASTPPSLGRRPAPPSSPNRRQSRR